jgi:hypothetical protein
MRPWRWRPTWALEPLRYAVADLNLGLPVPGRRQVTLSLAVTNLFGNRHQEFVGAPLLGRLLVGRVRVAF